MESDGMYLSILFILQSRNPVSLSVAIPATTFDKEKIPTEIGKQ
jgi:hypothetical protein